MLPHLIAFDLDGTLLASDKSLSAANLSALHDMERCGVKLALASGRLGSSMMKAVAGVNIDFSMITLNGAAVYKVHLDPRDLVYSASLDARFARELIELGSDKPLAVNFYIDGQLYTVKNPHNREWIDLYYQQTRTDCRVLENFDMFAGRSPSKMIFITRPAILDEMQEHFRRVWDGQVYVCRTWDYYLEFLSPRANKAQGITALARELGADLRKTVSFGDAENDIPMLQASGLGIAMKNAPDAVKKEAACVSQWTNDEDGVAREWERIKREGIGNCGLRN